VDTDISHVSLDLPIAERNFPLTQGSGHLQTTSEKVSFQGHSLFYGEPTTISWQKSFKPETPSMVLDCKSRLSKAMLKAYFPEGTKYLEGTPECNLYLKKTSETDTEVELRGNLAHSTLILGSWRRLQQSPSIFNFKGICALCIT
jgi:hypothetical protein